MHDALLNTHTHTHTHTDCAYGTHCHTDYNYHYSSTYEITHVKEVIRIGVLRVVLAAMFALSASNKHLSFLSVTSTSIAALIGAIPTIIHRLGVVFAMAI